MDPIKVKAIQEWPVPKRIKEVQAFLGFGNYYQKFIKKYSDLVKPLTALTRKGIPWTWGVTEQNAFFLIKGKFAEDPVLIMIQLDKPF